MTTVTTVQRDRLLALIEFSQQSAKLRGKPAATVAAHRLLAIYEHELQGLPGIRLNVTPPDAEDEIWLGVERLHETKPPNVGSAMLEPWVQMTQAPTEEPRLRDAVHAADLIAAGTHCSSEKPEAGKSTIDPNTKLELSAYEHASLIRAQFDTYVTTKWRPWSDEEKRRRTTIRLYSQLFTLKHQLEGSIVEAALELVWGVGLGIWNFSGATVSYPLIGQLVELSLDTETAEVQIRPRDLDARIEVDWYAAVDNPGLANFENAAKEFFGNATVTFSPFDRGAFEALLRTAVANLDANGVYWPDIVPPEDRTVPKPDDKLKVTDTWVLFARPRTNNVFVQDLEKLKKQAAEAELYPPAVAAIVTDPMTTNPVVELPAFRGVSGSSSSEYSATEKKARDLYFPKPFNDEQVRIVQLLDVSDGVVVQGPPGTGKTHTIANVICHYLAEGKRVLVTSMKDPALAVLQQQLPEEIRPLAISLLTTELDGMKQFEHAIYKIASEIQGLDRVITTRAINRIEESIEGLHGKIFGIDRKIDERARKNLTKLVLESEEITAEDAAREVVQNGGQFEWIPDSLGISRQFAPQFSNADVVRLREARHNLSKDIDYLDASLPQLIEFPDSKTLLKAHQDLSQFEQLKQSIDNGHVPALVDSTENTISLAQTLMTEVESLEQVREEVFQAKCSWTAGMRQRLRTSTNDHVLSMLDELGAELVQAMELRKSFLERPVNVPLNIERNAELVAAVRNLAEGKSAFGLKGLFGKSAEKADLESIRVLDNVPTNAEIWKHVYGYLVLLRRLRELGIRWNALAREVQLDMSVGDGPNCGLLAAQTYAVYVKLRSIVTAERQISLTVSRLFPNWNRTVEISDEPQALAEVADVLRHHLAKNRLVNAWANKEKFQRVLEARTGRVIADIRRFLADTLGNPKIDDAAMQAKWSELMAELSRVHGLSTELAAVRQVCEKIAASGAAEYARSLKLPLEGTVDVLLPDNWRQAWRLKRLATYLESIDAQQEIKRLANERSLAETDLAHNYRDLVVKRTWLKLAENASPGIRAALQAYLIAIQKIGKGTGKRAIRYRQDARMAAAQANPAVPCWIMPHYRVSESLPALLGCFDLVVIDEASQSDLTALPSLLRAAKVLVVGDDKQVSPEGVGLEEEKIRSLMTRFLANQVSTYLPQMSPERSIYDLYKVVFASSAVMLKEHFRCVAPIIEYSKREFYNHELRPLRVPHASERLDPPLIDVVVQNGYRKGDVNLPEARFIIDEIKTIVNDGKMGNRSIGVVSLLGDKQALAIWERLTDEIGPELIQRHRIECGDARTFQGKERDIMFLSMVSAPNDIGAALSRDIFQQRFNVAASRARDRMYLVRSVQLEQLSKANTLRRGLIEHFAQPFRQNEERVQDLRKLCESDFERDMYDELTQRGYSVTPQVGVGPYRIDLVTEGQQDTRLAIECDGDKYHGADKWADDMRRQRVLERAGWTFWRCFASRFIRRRNEVVLELCKILQARGIEPVGAEGAPQTVHAERRMVTIASGDNDEGDFNHIEPIRNTDRASWQLQLSSQTREAEGSAKISAGRPDRGNTDEYNISADRAARRNADTAWKQNSLNFQVNENPSEVSSSGRDGNRAYKNSRSSKPNHDDVIKRKTGSNRVVEGLAALAERFKNPRCSQCKGIAHIRVHTAGPVVVCADPHCNKAEDVEFQTLQQLARHLRVMCRKCNGANVMSVRGPFGNYLRCGDCQTNTSWQFVAGYTGKR